MKLNKILTGILLLTVSASWGQSATPDPLIERYYKYPQEAVKAADEMYQKAVKENNNPLLIRSLILKTTFTLEINRDKYPQLFQELEGYINKEHDLKAKSILHSYTGQLYRRYYYQNSYIINQRTSIEGDIPQNIEEWSGNIFKEKIYYHLLASIEPREILQQTPISDYNQIIVSGEASNILRPTLYDFLCHRAIDLIEDSWFQNNPQTPETNPAILAGAETFIQIPITVIPLYPKSNLLKIWQELLAFRLKVSNQDALLFADFERLDYAYQIYRQPNKDSLYLVSLQDMRNTYISNPMVIEIMAKEARQLIRNSYETISPRSSIINRKESIAAKLQALAICEEGIRQYPNYKRINLLHSIIKEIKAPELNAEFAKTIYPGEKLSIKISFQNINSATISLYRIKTGTIEYLSAQGKEKKQIPQTKLLEQNYRLSPTLVRQDTIIDISIPEPGLYKITIKAPNAKESISDDFICTSLFSTNQVRENKSLYQVRDWQSGKPVKNAKVLLYTHRSSEYIPIDTLFTNAQGIATAPKSSSANQSYQVINAENPNGYLTNIYPFEREIKSAAYTDLITDRKIYRPGQTVYFKGIAWKATPDSLFTQSKKEFNITFRDANDKEVAHQKAISNSFGSFTGSFVIPAQTLNGYFTITAGQGQTFIQVAEYKRPEFEVIFSEPQQTYHTGNMIHVKGKVSSFSGVKLADNTVKYQISRMSSFFWMPQAENSIQGITQTNSDGEFELEFKAEQPSQSVYQARPYFYRVTATITDSKGETQENSTNITIYTGKATPVVDIPEQVNKDMNTAFRISLEDLQSASTPQKVHYTIFKLVSPSKPQVASEIRDTLIEKIILQGQLNMARQDSITPSLQYLPSGAYLFTVENNNSRASKIFYLYSLKDKKPPIPTYSWLVKEKVLCLPGETARIKFGTSLQNAYVTYEIFSSGKLIKENTQIMSDEIINIDIPYKTIYGNQIWLYITYVKNKNYIREIIPIQRQHESRKLTIETKVFRDKLIPGQQEEWKIRILNAKGLPVEAEVLAMMYDASLDKFVANEINFNPSYLYQGFPYNWNNPYVFDMQNNLRLSPWAFKQPDYPIPPLSFDELNLYSYTVVTGFAKSEHSLSFGSAPQSIRVRGSNNMDEVMGESAVRAKEKQDAAAPETNLNTGTDMETGIQFRQNFQETAFFYPQLQPDSAGNLNLKFTMPESTTKWKFTVLAYTRELAAGKLVRYITTSKPLMVRPNMPRFFRSGDHAELKVNINNLSDSLQQGQATLELFIPGSDKVIFNHSLHFNMTANKNQTVSYSFNVPQGIDLLGCRISATNGNFSDGEQHLIAVLPDESLITETLPFFSNQKGTQSYRLENQSSTRKDYRLTLELTANPIWYAVLALPTLTEAANENITDLAAAYYVNTIAAMIARSNPRIASAIQNWKSTHRDPETLLSKLGQNSELKSILLEVSPWVLQAQNETERIQTLVQLFDQNRLEYFQAQALEKLAKLQTPTGGWSWFKGMYPSRFMTTNVLAIMARANSTGQKEYGEQEKRMQIRALRYLDEEINKDFKNKPEQIHDDQILYLYVRSMYRDIPLGDALDAHKYFMSLAQKQWPGFSFYEKAIIAVAMSQYGLTTDARSILKSLRKYAETTPEMGTYWPNNRNIYYQYSAIQAHTAIMEAFYRIEGNTPELNPMKQWLLRQKQTQSWGSVPSTVDAIYTLLLTGNNQLAQQEQLTVQLGQHNLTTPIGSNPLGYLKKSYSAGEITPDMLTAKITKTSDSPSWGGLYLQYFEKFDQVKKQKTGIGVDKKLFIEQESADGNKELVPLNQRTLRIGDKVVVRLTLSLSQDMEFLCLKNLQAACFEPVQQISGNQWKFGTVYYEDVKDAATNLFFNALSRGTYVIEYPVWVNQSGEYQDGIATFQSIYAPEYNSFSEAERIKVKN